MLLLWSGNSYKLCLHCHNLQTFDQLIELACKGNARKVDQYTDEVFSSKNAADSDDNFYVSAEDAKPALIYAFGKAAAGHGHGKTHSVICLQCCYNS
jgi:hypothetical protein